MRTHVHTHGRKDRVRNNLIRFLSSARQWEIVALERMFALEPTSSTFCLRASAVRSIAAQNLHLVPSSPTQSPPRHPKANSSSWPWTPSSLANREMFPLWPVQALPEHGSSLIWVPRQSHTGGSHSREGGQEEGSRRQIKAGGRRPFNRQPEEKPSHAHPTSADWATSFPFPVVTGSREWALQVRISCLAFAPGVVFPVLQTEALSSEKGNHSPPTT